MSIEEGLFRLAIFATSSSLWRSASPWYSRVRGLSLPSPFRATMVTSEEHLRGNLIEPTSLEAAVLTHTTKDHESCHRQSKSVSFGAASTDSRAEAEISHPQPELAAVDEGYLKDWRAFGRSAEIPPLVMKLMHDVKALELQLGENLVFGGPRGTLKGKAKALEEHMHRSFYANIPAKKEKLPFFTARQVACRILGSKGYLCEHCWLPLIDCMCQKIVHVSLWAGIRLWLYMHPKDYLRKNNSGKLLWQVFGEESARFCIYGMQEQEDAMWAALRQAGEARVWYLYPERSLIDNHVHEISIPEDLVQQKLSLESYESGLNFVLIDGTWNNSKALVSRLQNRAKETWHGQYIQSVSLSPERLSVMHGLRPQPSLEQTCTAAAAAQLLRELDLREELVDCHLGKAADALEDALQHLHNSLASRRQRVGRAIGRAKQQ